MGMYRALACAFGALVACSFTPSGDGGGGDDDAAVGDDAAGDDAGPGVDAVTPDAPATTDAAPPDAGCVETCSGDDAITCSGGTPMSERCDLGCSTTGGVHCRVMVPSNLPDASDLTGVTAGLTFAPAQDYYLLTDTGEIVYDVGGVRMTLRAAGGDVGGTRFRVVSDTLAVLAVDTLTLPATARVYGFGNRGLIVLARGAITIGGEIDFSAGCFLGQTFTRACGGPGAGDGGTSAAVNGAGCAGSAGGARRHRGTSSTGGGGGALRDRGAATAAARAGSSAEVRRRSPGSPGRGARPASGGGAARIGAAAVCAGSPAWAAAAPRRARSSGLAHQRRAVRGERERPRHVLFWRRRRARGRSPPAAVAAAPSAPACGAHQSAGGDRAHQRAVRVRRRSAHVAAA
ncbi:MAG: hypothetical protein HS111_12275 [Kofleriaceae bacterium]|nr:hypothetical protein [Kofleriaceae bacterium]